MKVSRRYVVSTLAMAPALGLFGNALAQTPTAESYADSTAADQWMQGWMPLGAVAGALHVMRFADAYYAVTKQIDWTPEDDDKPLPPVEVPIGFVTDFASIPRAFWSLLPRDGQYTYAAIVHDYLYWNQATSREEADNVFKAVMEEFNVAAPSIAIIFSAVRAGGNFAWDGNARAKADGESRVLSRFPDDPKVKWADWKFQPGVLG